jgi:naphthalene 1,2-dioxygenase system ferredoxin subunit
MTTELKEFVATVPISELHPDEPRRVTIGEFSIAVYNLQGKYYATDDCCSHGLASLAMGFVDGNLIECPLHGGAFDIITGKAAKSPCVEDIRTFETKVEEGILLVCVPK